MPALNPVFANAEDTHDEPISGGDVSFKALDGFWLAWSSGGRWRLLFG